MQQEQQRRQMWLYIIILTILIGGLWLFFMKREFAFTKNAGGSAQENLGEQFNNLKADFSSGIKALKRDILKF